MYLNDVLVGTIPTSSLTCTCTPGPNTQTLEFTNTDSFVPNGTNKFRVDTIAGSGCYTIAVNPALSNNYGRVTY